MRSRARLGRLIIAAGALLIIAFAGSTAHDGWRLREQVRSATERELGNLSRSLADESARNLQAVDALLRDTAIWYEESGRTLAPEAITAALAARVAGAPHVSVLTIVDAEGRQLYRSRQTGEPLADVSDRPYYRIQRERPDTGLFINEPVVTRTERVPALVISRGMTRQGSFDGLATAIVTLHSLRSRFDTIRLGEGSSLLLAMDDGALVVRHPVISDVENTQKVPEIVALKGGAVMDRLISPVDGRAKLVAAVGVGTRPMTLAVTRDEAVALSPWRDGMWGAVARTTVLCLLVVLTTIGLLKQLRRLDMGEQALRQSEERYALAMEAANGGHAEWNLTQDTVFASDAWMDLHGVKHRRLVCSADLVREIMLHEDDRPLVKAAIEEHLAGRSPGIELDYRVRHGSSQWRWIHARGRCLREPGSGRPLRLFSSAIDVTERKEAEAAKADLEGRRQQARRLEALGTLAGGIAHDFNNILGAILGFGQMARQQAEPDSRIGRHLDRVMQAGARARLLVRQILDFSRSGVTQREPVNVQSVVEEVVAMLRPSLPSGLRLETRLEAGNAAVMGDATQLYQAVMNVCTNAVQAVGEIGRITVCLRWVDLTEPRVLLQGELRPGRHVQLEVADSGGGMPPHVLARMFDPFFTTKKVGEGTGLGLSVVHGIVADLGGAIDASTRQGEGTVVSIWLPVSGESGVPIPPPAREWPRGSGEIVIVVDDEPALVELAEEQLAELGYEPVGFDSAEAALRAFAADPGRFDLLLTDETMPGMAGCEMAMQLHRTRPKLPVVLMSGNVNADMEQRACQSGVAVVLRKPLALQDLAETLARLLRDK